MRNLLRVLFWRRERRVTFAGYAVQIISVIVLAAVGIPRDMFEIGRVIAVFARFLLGHGC